FLLIYFKKRNLYFYLTFDRLMEFWTRAENGGRKSFRFDELDLSYQIPIQNSVCVHYLEILQRDLESRENLST
ncbi:MAG TPA: Holliday junction resolvase RecU, partial [Mobilitalea sp.]|nr:Holliday junction resolvase RecU [Mobilitalea sp.]